jgi:two-component system LytT family response regulator
MNNNFSCIIIDDEPCAADLLAEVLKNLYNNVKIIGIYNSWKKASLALRNMDPDILFLDISIKGKNSMDLVKLLPNLKSEIIFVTAFSEYELVALKYGATGYLLKPIDDIELRATVDIAVEKINNEQNTNSG